MLVPFRAVFLDVLSDLDRQGLHQHPAGSFTRQLVKGRILILLFRVRRLVVYLQHGWRLLSPGRPARVLAFDSRERLRRLLHTTDPQLSVISRHVSNRSQQPPLCGVSPMWTT